MATLKIPDENRTISDVDAIRDHLRTCGIDYETWAPAGTVGPDAPDADILSAYADPIARLQEKGGYVKADVIGVTPETPGLDAMLEKFSREHTHAEDEVRFIVDGHGIFHVHPVSGPVVAIELEPGDLISVPAGTLHWFDLCSDRRVRAIRLFQDPSGWTPEYSESGIDERYEPVCFGPAFVSSGG